MNKNLNRVVCVGGDGGGAVIIEFGSRVTILVVVSF
jgi:hypothetical protein